MTEGEIAAYVAGLCVCYFGGYKVGAVVSWVKKLGTTA